MNTKKAALDLSRLLGFDSLPDSETETVDFRDDAIASRLGAKIGETMTPAPAATAPLDLSRLLGFDALSADENVDFRQDAVATRLGAKIGSEPAGSAKL